MITTPNISFQHISKRIICYIFVVIITMPGSHLIAGNFGGFPNNNDDGHASFMFRINEKTAQVASSAVDAELRIKEFFSSPDVNTALFSHFHGSQKRPSAEWIRKAEQLKMLVIGNKFNLTIKLASSSEMDYMMSAFVGKGTDGLPNALINRNWIEYGVTNEALTRIIIEQSGFAFDRFLNGENDTAGNEGKSFANTLSTIYEEESSASLSSNFIVIEGKKLVVEF